MPTAREVDACRPWLEAEIAAIEPDLIVCLGATAAQGILGREFRVTRQRGEICERPGGPSVLATFHPSAILRAPDEAARHAMRRGFVHDLKSAAKFLQRHSVAQRERHKKRV
jgi:DNA polymerase